MTRVRGRPRYDQEDASAAEAFRSIGSKVQLNRDEAAPLWVQLRNQVEEAINTGRACRRRAITRRRRRS
ncbi:hypothetical protein RFM40_01680 [Mesorhizobium sp. VK22E]|nr:hypothetical protein [Mesorhizobium sp. VK22E]